MSVGQLLNANCVGLFFSSVSRMLREQWIRAKYERNEFEFIEKQEPYSAGTFFLTISVKTLMSCVLKRLGHPNVKTL